MVVRGREPADVAGCVAALRAVHDADRYPTAWPADPAAWLDPPGTTAAWVAELDGTVVGHVCVAPAPDAAVAARTGVPAERLVAVKRLFTTPAARGRGVGAALVGVAAARAGDGVWLDVVDGEPAVAFYERLGWRRVGTRPADWVALDGGRRTVHLYVAPVR
ncbi:GNAT family N-acetyltransferase [Pseudonocardia hydrocarbonoxydans]|uniref:GNAT family N-acetyltransferase n=1 Tax=Pseudonocardia hydrocarbonoxydans TaxID=76726 RepID=UPI001144E001|nr:GNAT family N-acetyltransferase [Pseudonocardia hydrocarbonoxydans]